MPLIYSLSCPIRKRVFYVGFSTVSAESRLMQHLSAKRLKTIVDLVANNLLPTLGILEQGEHVSTDTEKEWINKMFIQGEPLENIDGLLSHAERSYINGIPIALLNTINLSSEDRSIAALRFILNELPIDPNIPISLRIKNIAEWGLNNQ